MTDIKQFKLSSGEEIICDVLEWPDLESDDSADIVVKNVFKIVAYDPATNGDRYYTFRPWMSFQDEEDMFQLINWNHIVGEANPSQKLLKHYITAVKGEITPENEQARREIEERLEAYINNLRATVENRALETTDDSDGGSKVIRFPGRTFH
jgi:hypothetical protein